MKRLRNLAAIPAFARRALSQRRGTCTCSLRNTRPRVRKPPWRDLPTHTVTESHPHESPGLLYRRKHYLRHCDPAWDLRPCLSWHSLCFPTGKGATQPVRGLSRAGEGCFRNKRLLNQHSDLQAVLLGVTTRRGPSLPTTRPQPPPHGSWHQASLARPASRLFEWVAEKTTQTKANHFRSTLFLWTRRPYSSHSEALGPAERLECRSQCIQSASIQGHQDPQGLQPYILLGELKAGSLPASNRNSTLPLPNSRPARLLNSLR